MTTPESGLDWLICSKFARPCFTELKAEGPSRTCYESQKEEEGRMKRGTDNAVRSLLPRMLEFTPRVTKGISDRANPQGPMDHHLWVIQEIPLKSSVWRSSYIQGTPTNTMPRWAEGVSYVNSHGARLVHLITTMIKWIRTSRLSIKNSLASPQTSL